MPTGDVLREWELTDRERAIRAEDRRASSVYAGLPEAPRARLLRQALARAAEAGRRTSG